jgi:hypothetical protein
MTVTTRGGAVYSIDYRDLDGAGQRLAVCRLGGPDDPPGSSKPMAEDTWYRVAVLTPLPPEIGTHVAMVLDPVDGDTEPIVRFSTLVTSVVGVL